MIKSSVNEIASVLSAWPGPITVAYSGGKDSSAVMKLAINALMLVPEISARVSIIYCDTRVENPIVDEFVKKTLRKLKSELESLGLNTRVKVLYPNLSQRYFVRIIGRGYPPPTTFFRWCTKDLRIRPVQKFIREMGHNSLVLIGTRWGESRQRDRVLQRASGDAQGPVLQRQMDGGGEAVLYLPIALYALEDVWETLTELEVPRSIDVHALAQLYRHAGGECPMIRDSNDQPCASARFGCWVCTVVRRDRSAENLVKAGFEDLRAYHDFRTWLSQIRNESSLRCKKRRNGQFAPGPFTLEARRLIFHRVRQLEMHTGKKLINRAEERLIRSLWSQDRSSAAYIDMERG